ncbi:hypothetical protein U0070_025945, partial [Myodes glareolus]
PLALISFRFDLDFLSSWNLSQVQRSGGACPLSVPISHFDRCCWAHDRCYGELEKKGCDIRFQSYDYRVTGGLVTCEYGSYCSTRLCDCDRTLVYCLRRNLWNYNPDYQFYPNFLC